MQARRDLTTCENTGTVIVNKTSGSKAQIIGSYVGGFVVRLMNDKAEGLAVGTVTRLPFENIHLFSVEGE